jgi:hypothetical protein
MYSETQKDESIQVQRVIPKREKGKEMHGEDSGMRQDRDNNLK